MKLPSVSRRNQIIIVVLIILIIPSIFIYNYTQNNPRFCTTCHIMIEAYDTWQESPHRVINCHECHRTSIGESLQHVFDVLTKNPQEVTKPVDIENSWCEECHISEDPQWLQVRNTAGHLVHVYEGEVYAECIDCHGVSLHIFRPPEEACFQCHDVERLHAAEVMMAKCVSCHDFLVADDPLIPQREDCLECHPNRETIVVIPPDTHMNSTCTLCHDPHEITISEECVNCHVGEGGLHDVPDHNICTSCHIPHMDLPERAICETCHEDRVDHFAPISCTTCHG